VLSSQRQPQTVRHDTEFGVHHGVRCLAVGTYGACHDGTQQIIRKNLVGFNSITANLLWFVIMLPGMKGVIWSEITRFVPPQYLEERFWGTGMHGTLAFEFVPHSGGTLLIQRGHLSLAGLLKILAPLVKGLLLPNIEPRLDEIRNVLEFDPGIG
jgi:hypothetical protein